MQSQTRILSRLRCRRKRWFETPSLICRNQMAPIGCHTERRKKQTCRVMRAALGCNRRRDSEAKRLERNLRTNKSQESEQRITRRMSLKDSAKLDRARRTGLAGALA